MVFTKTLALLSGTAVVANVQKDYTLPRVDGYGPQVIGFNYNTDHINQTGIDALDEYITETCHATVPTAHELGLGDTSMDCLHYSSPYFTTYCRTPINAPYHVPAFDTFYDCMEPKLKATAEDMGLDYFNTRLFYFCQQGCNLTNASVVQIEFSNVEMQDDVGTADRTKSRLLNDCGATEYTGSTHSLVLHTLAEKAYFEAIRTTDTAITAKQEQDLVAFIRLCPNELNPKYLTGGARSTFTLKQTVALACAAVTLAGGLALCLYSSRTKQAPANNEAAIESV